MMAECRTQPAASIRERQPLAMISTNLPPGCRGAAAKMDRASVALRQAEERTRLVVDCAGLVKRMEQLDFEIVGYVMSHPMGTFVVA